MSTAAVIVTYNNTKTIEGCIESLRANGITQVLVIDNASTDDTVKRIETLPVGIIKNKKNVGFATAVNQAAKKIKSEYLLLLNPDANLLTPIKVAQEYFQQHSRVGVIGLQLQDAQGQPERYSYGKEVTPTSFITRRLLPSSSSKCDWVSGGAMMIRRQAFDEVRGFTPDFFMYWEDVDFCRRVRQAGWKVARLAAVKVMHHRGTSLKNTKKKTRIYDASADIYFHRHYSTPIWALQHILRRIYRLFWRQVR